MHKAWSEKKGTTTITTVINKTCVEWLHDNWYLMFLLLGGILPSSTLFFYKALGEGAGQAITGESKEQD